MTIITAEISTKVCSEIKTGSIHCELRNWAKSAMHDCLLSTMRMTDTGELEDDRTWKEKVLDKIYQLLFDWDCSPGWYRFARYVELFIMDAFVDLFITLCSLSINTSQHWEERRLQNDPRILVGGGDSVNRITLCIVSNTAFMACDHADIEPYFASVLNIGNNVRTTYTLHWPPSAENMIIIIYENMICGYARRQIVFYRPSIARRLP